MHQQPTVIPTVVYDTDGHPHYAYPTVQTAPLTPYQPAMQPAAPTVIYQPAPLTGAPQGGSYSPLRDPVAVRLAAGGIGLGAAGVGLSFLFTALAAATTAIGLLLGVLALVYLLAHSGGSRGAVNVRVDNRFTNRNR